MEIVKNGIRASAFRAAGMSKGADSVGERGYIIDINLDPLPPIPDVMPTITGTLI